MYYIVPAESLTDPLILNDMHILGVDVVKSPASSPLPYWYEFIAEGEASQAEVIGQHLKTDWYAACFSEKDLTIIFAEKAFTVIADHRLTADAAAARAQGIAVAIQEQYLDWQNQHTLYRDKLKQAQRK